MPNFPFVVSDSLQIGTATISATGNAIVLPAGTTVGATPVATTTEVATGGGPKITNLQITDATWAVLDDTAVDTAGGYVLVTGTNFVTGALVYFNQTPATSVAFVSATALRVTVPALAAATYIVYVINPDGGTAIRVPGLTASANPAWQTASALPEQYDNVAITLTLVATDATSYTITSGSLPPGLSLNSNTGVITGTVTGITLDTVYTFTVRATDAQLQDSPRTFTVTITVSDPYFKLTTLLLSGSAISANTVVRDSSTNNFNLAVFGDARASNFTPYGTGWSNYFDGSGDWLVTSNVGTTTGDFTLELWCYLDSSQPQGWYPYIFGTNSPWQGSGGIGLAYNTQSGVADGTPLYFNVAGGGITVDTHSNLKSRWVHLALTRSGSTIRAFLNGTVLATTLTNSSTINTSTFMIGGVDEGGSYGNHAMKCWISNFRFVKDSALYTANFTPATSSLTSITNTALLICQSNRFVDNSANNYSLSRSGDVKIDSFNPFNITNTGVNGSMYFDGTGDYIQAANSANLDVGTGDFSIEAWCYKTNTSTATDWRVMGGSVSSSGFFGDGGTTSSRGFGIGRSGVAWDVTSNVQAPIYEWFHICYTRKSGAVRIFLNGKLIAYATGNTNNYGLNAGTLQIVAEQGGNLLTGYLTDFRLFKTVPASYDTAITTINNQVFTPPTQPLTAIANTQLLTLQYRQPHNNHTFLDSSSNQFLITRNGNASQGTFSPFSQSGWSSYFNGSDAYLSYTQAGSTYPSQLSFLNGASATGTIECWVYPLSSSQGTNPAEAPAILAVGDTYFSLNVTTTNKARFYWYTTVVNNLDSTASVPFNAWTHIAAVRNGASVTLYINGASSGSIAYTGWNWASGANGSQLKIGYHAPYSTARYFNGYISNLRIINGTALYTANFTPATSSLTAITNTSLLVCHSNRFVDSSVSNTVFTVSGTPQVQAFSPFAATAVYSPVTHGGSGYLDGSGDYFILTNESAYDFGDGNFSIDFWYYPLSAQGYGGIYTRDGQDYPLSILSGTSITPAWPECSMSVGTTTTWFATGINTSGVQKYAWNHIAFTRVGNTFRAFTNGVLSSVVTASGTMGSGGTPWIGKNGTAAGLSELSMYLSGFRMTKGGIPTLFSTSSTTTGTTIFAVPTQPFTANDSLTGGSLSILANFADAAILDSTGRTVLETAADAKTSSVVTKFTGGSMSFDGAGDAIIIRSSDLLTFGTGDWTVEFWVYHTSVSGQQTYLGDTPSATSGPYIYKDSSHKVGLYYSTQILTGTTTIAINTWYFIVLSRASGTVRLFINGIQETSASDTTNLTVAIQWVGGDTLPSGYLSGYMNDIRVTKGYARYTANFTAPTAPARLK